MSLRLVLAGMLLTLPVLAQLSPLETKPEEASAVQPPSNALDKGDLEFYVRHLYVYGPQIDLEVGDFEDSDVPGLKKTTITASYKLARKQHEFFVSEDGKHILEGKTYVIDANPYQEVNDAIDVFTAPAFGKEGASVRIVAYSDFECPYCAEEAKVLRNQLRHQYGSRVRLYFRDFPLDMHPWARPAAETGRCIFVQEPERFWDFHDWVFENQKSITPQNLNAKTEAFLADKGLDMDKFRTCRDERKRAQDVEDSMAEGRKVGVTSTPTLFVNGRQLGGSTKWEQLKAIIDYEIEYQKVTKNAGDDCGCSVELPSFP